MGHTHELCLVSYDGHKATRNDLLQGTVRLRPDRRYMVNVGSVGQPRDGTNHAKYVLWDPIARAAHRALRALRHRHHSGKNPGRRTAGTIRQTALVTTPHHAKAT